MWCNKCNIIIITKKERSKERIYIYIFNNITITTPFRGVGSNSNIVRKKTKAKERKAGRIW